MTAKLNQGNLDMRPVDQALPDEVERRVVNKSRESQAQPDLRFRRLTQLEQILGQRHLQLQDFLPSRLRNFNPRLLVL